MFTRAGQITNKYITNYNFKFNAGKFSNLLKFNYKNFTLISNSSLNLNSYYSESLLNSNLLQSFYNKFDIDIPTIANSINPNSELIDFLDKMPDSNNKIQKIEFLNKRFKLAKKKRTKRKYGKKISLRYR
jgi:hypothetical protein